MRGDEAHQRDQLAQIVGQYGTMIVHGVIDFTGLVRIHSFQYN